MLREFDPNATAADLTESASGVIDTICELVEAGGDPELLSQCTAIRGQMVDLQIELVGRVRVEEDPIAIDAAAHLGDQTIVPVPAA